MYRRVDLEFAHYNKFGTRQTMAGWTEKITFSSDSDSDDLITFYTFEKFHCFH